MGTAILLITNSKKGIIQLTYTIKAFDTEKGQMEVRISIDNQTTTDFKPSQWSLHWNQIIGTVIPESLPPGVAFTWINGNSYFKLNFGDDWGLRAGEQLHVDMIKDGIMSRLALGPFGAFLVQNESLYEAKTTVKWESAKGLKDLKLPTSKTRYENLSAVSLISKEALPKIVPTPQQLTVLTDDRPTDTHWQIYLSPRFLAYRQDLEQLIVQTTKKIKWVDALTEANLIITQATDLGDEDYTLEIGKQKTIISAKAYGGMVYAIQSLIQLDVAAQIASNRLPQLSIKDARALPTGGFYWTSPEIFMAWKR